jgi:hypothetical protein
LSLTARSRASLFSTEFGDGIEDGATAKILRAGERAIQSRSARICWVAPTTVTLFNQGLVQVLDQHLSLR